jgi:hypothetical protein
MADCHSSSSSPCRRTHAIVRITHVQKFPQTRFRCMGDACIGDAGDCIDLSTVSSSSTSISSSTVGIPLQTKDSCLFTLRQAKLYTRAYRTNSLLLQMSPRRRTTREKVEHSEILIWTFIRTNPM